MSILDRCEITGNPVGTDTWTVGQPCKCLPCETYRLRAEIERLTDENRKMNATLASDAIQIFEIETENERLREQRNALVAAITAFSNATSLPNGPSLAIQRHEPTWDSWKGLFAAIKLVEGK